jgi:alkylation response protein AidB-like acyl-CoA dehydrogenase
VTARLLASTGSPAAAEVLGGALLGTTLATLALHRAEGGRLPLVPAGAVADVVVALDGHRLLLVPNQATEPRHVANLGGLPLADLVVTDGAVEIAAGEEARTLFETAIDEWLTLTAAALVGIGARAHEMAAGYAVERQAWGVPIGTFQAISHPLADQATALDGARLLTRKAAWSAEAASGRSAELAAMAFAFAAETARDTTYHALHVHGGYGFMLEQDVQLYYRRARGWARVWGEPRAGFRRAASHRYGQED